MWSEAPHVPLVPANAGIQMAGRGDRTDWRWGRSNASQSFSIWVPAFAGMSGGFN